MSEEQKVVSGKPAIVVRIVDDFQVAINSGSRDGMKKGQRFLIFGLSESEVFDPITEESLGRLEIVRGRGVITHVQERLATIRSTEKDQGRRRTIQRSAPIWGNFMGEKEIITAENEDLPFCDPQEGDFARPI